MLPKQPGRTPRLPRSIAPFAALAVLVVVALTTSGCSHHDDQAERVLVIGDSLTVGAAGAGLGQDDQADWTVDAVIGRGTPAGVQAAKDHDAGSYDRVIVALGTNDFTDTQATYAELIDQMMAAIGPDVPVTWINVDAESPHVAAAARGVNPAIAAAPARFSNLKVADWSTYVNGRADAASLRAGDGTHYDQTGYEVRARWMESLVAS